MKSAKKKQLLSDIAATTCILDNFDPRFFGSPQEATADAEQRWAEEALAEVAAAEELEIAGEVDEEDLLGAVGNPLLETCCLFQGVMIM